MNKRTVLSLLGAALVTAVVVFFLSYKTDIFYSKVNRLFSSFCGAQCLDVFNATGNQLDITRAFRARKYDSEVHDINLSLDRSVISHLEDISNTSFSDGFIRDDENTWQPAKLNYDSFSDVRASIKIHGTSTSPLRRSTGIWRRFGSKIFGIDTVFRLSTGGASFNVKLKSKEKYLDGIRRLALITSYDDWSIASNTLNRYAASQGLITSHGGLKNLFINGRPVGLYLAYERIDKELLERNYGITNYGEYKTNNVWDKSTGPGHTSQTDYTIYDQEQDGMDQVVPVGLSKLEELFLSIEQENINVTKSLVHIDNMAWVAAFEKLYGTDHSNIGDNRRYIYDPTTGKFRVHFRIEGAPVKLNANGAGNFESSSDVNGTDRLLKLLLSDPVFLAQRNLKLQQLLASSGDIISMVRQDLIKFQPILERSVRSPRELEFGVGQDIVTLMHNFGKIDEYLNYGRVMASLRKIGTGNHLEILNDSYTSSHLHSYQDCSGKTHVIGVDLNPASLVAGSQVTGGAKTIIAVPSSCISHMSISKNGVTMDKRDVFINYIHEIPPMMSYKDAILGEYTLGQNGASITFNKGPIRILSTVQLPKLMTLVIKPGVVIEMADGVSMVVRGPLIAEGTSALPITIRPKLGSRFGSFAVLGEPNKPLAVRLDYFNISGGGQSWVDGVLFTGQLAMHQTVFIAKNIRVSDSSSDDGLNVKNSSVAIDDSHFFDNVGDQIDLDFVTGEVSHSLFSRTNTVNESDGLDVSGSKVLVFKNVFQNFGDKGLSIGEQAELIVASNQFDNNEQGIAVKDGSTACILNNAFTDNNRDVVSYVKKKMYGEPKYEIYDDGQTPLSLPAIRTYGGCSFE